MRKMKNITKNRLALTAAVLITGCASSTPAPKTKTTNITPQNTDMGQCTGINSCKGSASCAVSGQNNCAGQNTCRGKGWVPLSKAECQSQNGQFSGFEKS